MVEYNIAKDFENTDKLYHFTSFDTALKILHSMTLRYGRLVNMNDMYESSKTVYASRPDIENNDFYEMNNALLKYRQLSFSEDEENVREKEVSLGFDLQQMWGNYADNGKGVCLVFDKNEIIKFPADKQGQIEYTNQLDECVFDSPAVIDRTLLDLLFQKRKEWEQEQEYRIVRKFEMIQKEEYVPVQSALKFIIITEYYRNRDDVLHQERINKIRLAVENKIPILIYTDALLGQSLVCCCGTEIWNEKNGYKVLRLGENSHVDIS